MALAMIPDEYCCRIAAPMELGEDPECVTLWCQDHQSRWWLVVDGIRQRRLNALEIGQATFLRPRASEPRIQIDSDAAMAELLPAPEAGESDLEPAERPAVILTLITGSGDNP